MGALRLVGTAEIAVMFGISRVRAQQLQMKKSFPEPAARLAAGRIYHYADVVEWAERTGREVRRDPFVD